MLETVTVDTHQIFGILRERGYTKEQADGFVEAIRELNLDKLATKTDMQQAFQDFRKEMKGEFEKIDLKLAQLEMKMTIKMGAFTFLLGGFLTAIKFMS